MPVHRTERNIVVAYEIGEDDFHCQLVWSGPGEAGSPYAKQFRGPVQPIEDYDSLVEWAIMMADQLEYHIHVVPLSGKDVLGPQRLPDGVANLTDQERGQLRGIVVKAMFDVLRDADDAAVRTDAYDLLRTMGVIHE